MAIPTFDVEFTRDGEVFQPSQVAALSFVIELDFLHGRDKLAGRRIETLLHY